ncbi:MAG: S41 family peptidase [Candidatus Omnitrophica bacterium]|nr:S41 family peptidase [Candidatus Omnitrophota bacterium]
MRGRSIFRMFMIVVVFSLSFSVSSFTKGRDDLYKELEIFAEGLAVIEKKYVEEKEPHDLIYGAMSGMLLSLDSYSQFLTQEDYEDLIVETEGKFGGLGIEITIRNGLLTIVSPIEDTPAWNAGVEVEDIIVKIDGELTKGITLHEAVDTLRGDPGTEVTITVLHEKDKTLEDITITRDIIKIKDIKYATVLEDGIGYVRIAEFREKTSDDLAVALKELSDKGLEGLIIDVRYNPGGLLSSAIDISSQFIEEGKTIVSTKSRSEKERVYTSVPFKKKYLDIPIIVLINKGSASGSEILAAALRENNKAILLGETSFGKGSVQTIIPLSDGSAMRLTTSKYYTPNGTSIHEKGIDPDIEVAREMIEKTEDNVFENLKEKEKDNNNKENPEKEPLKHEFDYKKDNQILRALDLLKGLLVFKG